MKKKKTIMKMVLAITLIMSNTTSALAAGGATEMDYANPTVELQAMIDANEENIITDEEIAAMSLEELEYYQLLPVDSEEGKMRAYTTYAANDDYTVTTTLVKQIKGNYCGSAATLMALYTAGTADSVSGKTSDAKQETLAVEYGISNTGGGTALVSVASMMNKYAPRMRDWVTYKVEDTSSGRNGLSIL